MLHLFNQYSKNIIIVKYHYNLFLYTIKCHFYLIFVLLKHNFEISTWQHKLTIQNSNLLCIFIIIHLQIICHLDVNIWLYLRYISEFMSLLGEYLYTRVFQSLKKINKSYLFAVLIIENMLY